VRFGLNGQACEIDLTDVHAQRFRGLLAPYVSVGRRLTRGRRLYVRIDLDTRTTAGRTASSPSARLTSPTAPTRSSAD
jgi:hypothetical protein